MENIEDYKMRSNINDEQCDNNIGEGVLVNNVDDGHHSAAKDEDEDGSEDGNESSNVAPASMWTRKDIQEFKDAVKAEGGEAIIRIGQGESVTVRKIHLHKIHNMPINSKMSMKKIATRKSRGYYYYC